MCDVPNDMLIAAAAALLKPHSVNNRLMANVGAALVTETGVQFEGVCVDTSSGTGWCAEGAAVAAMVTTGEYKIRKIVAVWRDEDGRLFVLPPCGRCRELLRQIDPENLETEIIVSMRSTRRLRDLLPLSEWPEPLEPPG